ncbi:MAG: transposase [Terracidiphilus sp.]|nr:transposase [Terracidiphilus sp.]
MRPSREAIRQNCWSYFATTQTANRKPFFRHQRWAQLLARTICHYAQSAFHLNAYVIMPDHFHVLLTPNDTLEKSMQLIKGGFSFRAGRELDWCGQIWQHGFSDHRIRDEQDWCHHLDYIRQNPVRARLAEEPVLYPYMSFPGEKFPQGLKPLQETTLNVRAEARTLQMPRKWDSTRNC